MDSPVHYSDNMVFTDPVRQPVLEKKIKHYSNFHQILLVGEGDFSFSSALANAFGSAKNMVPTSLDRREKVISSYEDGQKNLQLLERFGAMTLHGVNATKMCEHEAIRERKFDRIVFNFPRAGFHGKKEKDTAVIKKHRHLVKMFFNNAKTMLSRTGEIHVTHMVKDPYSQWKVVEEAEACGLFLKESVEYNKADYPGYTNRRGAKPIIGGTFFLGECRTYMFILRESMTASIMLLKNSLEALPEILPAIWELVPDSKIREAAETAKANMESSFNHLKTVSDKTIKERDEFERQRNEAIHQRDAAWREKEEAYREKEKIAKQLDDALKLKEEVTKESERILREHNDLAAEKNEVYREKENIVKWLAEALRLKEEVTKERQRILREQNDLENQKDEVYREKEKISEQLDEALILKQQVLKEMERILREQNDLSNQKGEAYWEKEKIAEQLNEVLTSKLEVSKEMEMIPREQNELTNQKDEVYKEKGKIAKWLDNASRLKEETIKNGKGYGGVFLRSLMTLVELINKWLDKSLRLIEEAIKKGKEFNWGVLLPILIILVKLISRWLDLAPTLNEGKGFNLGELLCIFIDLMSAFGASY